MTSGPSICLTCGNGFQASGARDVDLFCGPCRSTPANRIRARRVKPEQAQAIRRAGIEARLAARERQIIEQWRETV